MSRALGTALALTLVAPAVAAGRTPQTAILLATPAVVLVTAQVDAEVTMDCGMGPVTVRPAPFVQTGSGWFIDGQGWVITNAHVVDPVYRQPPWVGHELTKKAIDVACVDPVLKRRRFTPEQRPAVEDAIRRESSGRALASARITTTPRLLVTLSSGATLVAEVHKFSPPISFDSAGQPTRESARDLALLRVRDGTYPALAVGPHPKIGDPIHILGYPGVVMSHELLGRGALLEVSATNGSVSGFKPDAIGQEMIQTDAPAAHGNSGGPAVGDDARLVGVMAFTTLSGQGAVVQGFNFLIPGRDVLKFVADTPVKPGASTFNGAWRSALDAVSQERYATAAARLAEVNRLLPNLPVVKRELAAVDENIKNPRPRPFPWAWATLGVTLVSAGAYGAMFGRRWWKNRFRIQAGQVVGLIERGLDPLLVDARSEHDFETSPLTLPGAIRLPPERATTARTILDGGPESRQRIIVVYCTSPGERMSELVAGVLRAEGFRTVRILKGGLGGWANARLPVATKGHLPAVGVEIYKNLTPGTLESRRFPAGTVIVREGDEAHGEAFLIHAGTVGIRRQLDGAERDLGTMGEGQLFGQMALFRQAPRSAGVVALSDVELFVLKHEWLEWLIHNRPQATMEILKDLSDLVVQTDGGRVPPTGATTGI